MEFQLENYKLRLLEDGTIERLYEFKTKQYWKEIKFQKHKNGYLHKDFYFTSGKKHISHHRLVYYAHNQDWDIWDTTQEIDHSNRNRQDNRIENLTAGDKQKNQQNTCRKGYFFNKKLNKYVVQISVDKKRIITGYYTTEEEAIKARADAEKKYWNKEGSFCCG